MRTVRGACLRTKKKKQKSKKSSGEMVYVAASGEQRATNISYSYIRHAYVCIYKVLKTQHFDSAVIYYTQNPFISSVTSSLPA
jgi:hypothetical protein